MGLDASHTSPLILAANTFLASPSLIDFATSIAEVPFGYSLTEPSGNVICIMFIVVQCFFLQGKFNEVLANERFNCIFYP
jgi:hypothetical protein